MVRQLNEKELNKLEDLLITFEEELFELDIVYNETILSYDIHLKSNGKFINDIKTLEQLQGWLQGFIDCNWAMKYNWFK